MRDKQTEEHRSPRTKRNRKISFSTRPGTDAELRRTDRGPSGGRTRQCGSTGRPWQFAEEQRDPETFVTMAGMGCLSFRLQSPYEPVPDQYEAGSTGTGSRAGSCSAFRTQTTEGKPLFYHFFLYFHCCLISNTSGFRSRRTLPAVLGSGAARGTG